MGPGGIFENGNVPSSDTAAPDEAVNFTDLSAEDDASVVSGEPLEDISPYQQEDVIGSQPVSEGDIPNEQGFNAQQDNINSVIGVNANSPMDTEKPVLDGDLDIREQAVSSADEEAPVMNGDDRADLGGSSDEDGSLDTSSGSSGGQKVVTVDNDSEEVSHSAFTVEGSGISQQVTQTVEINTQTVTTTTYTPTYVDVQTAQSIISQVSEQIFVQLGEEESTMQLQLNPENLGRLIISVTTRANEVNAHIYAESEAVRQALESQMTSLRESLSSSGYKVGAVEVTVEEHGYDRNLEERFRDEQNRKQQQDRQQESGRRNIIRGELDSLSGLMTEEEELIARMMRENGNTMDMTA